MNGKVLKEAEQIENISGHSSKLCPLDMIFLQLERKSHLRQMEMAFIHLAFVIFSQIFWCEQAEIMELVSILEESGHMSIFPPYSTYTPLKYSPKHTTFSPPTMIQVFSPQDRAEKMMGNCSVSR